MYLFYYYLLQPCRLQSLHADGQVSYVKTPISISQIKAGL